MGWERDVTGTRNLRGAVAATTALLFGICAGTAPAAAGEAEPTKETQMNLKKVTPILFTHKMQACIDFWAEFGLAAVMTVPVDDKIIFAILTNGEVELMYQTFESAIADNPAAVEGINRSAIYLEVTSLDKILPAAKKHQTVKPEHTTDYGAREIYIRDPAGNLVGFAEQNSDGE